MQKISDLAKFEHKKQEIFNSTKPTNSTFMRTKCRKGAKTQKIPKTGTGTELGTNQTKLEDFGTFRTAEMRIYWLLPTAKPFTLRALCPKFSY